MNFERQPLESGIGLGAEIVRDTESVRQDPRIDSRGPADEFGVSCNRRPAREDVAPQLSLKHGGSGLDHSQTATVFRRKRLLTSLGHWPDDAMAPDEGKM